MTKEIKKVMNLDNSIPEDSLNGYLFSNENKGHKFIISCTKGGELQTLTGSVTVRFMRANNTTILLGQGGSDGRENYAQIVDGNAEVTLHPDCYNVPGRFKISVFNISGDTVSCIYVGVGTVSRTQNGELIDSGEIVPSIDELVGYIDDCITATENAEAAADHAVRYDVAQTLTEAQKAQARTNINASSQSDVDDLKSAIGYSAYSVPELQEINNTNYPNTLGLTTLYITNRLINKGDILGSLDFYASASGNGYFALINNDTNVVEYVKAVSAVGGGSKESVSFNYTAQSNLRLGVVGLSIKYRQNKSSKPVDTINAFATDGLYESTNASPAVGDVLAITKSSSSKFSFALQWHVMSSETVKNVESLVNQPQGFYGKWLPKKMQTKNGYIRYIDGENDYCYIGRWYPQPVNGTDCMVTNTCGAEIHFSVSGTTSITVGWVAMTAGVTYYAYSIDNGAVTRALITSNTITIPDTGKHYVRLITDGITENIGKWENGTGFAFSGVTGGTCTEAIPTNPMIAFYGDSITEGIRALGISQSDMGETNSATGAFPWFTCEKLGAVSYRVGYGASGVLVTGSFNTAINALNYYYANHPVNEFYPAIIVANYGENDSTADETAFANAYQAFIDAAKIKYPGVVIFVVVPFSQKHASALGTLVQNNTDSCILVETGDWTGITYADGVHPLSAGAEVIGQYLSEAVLDAIY